MPQQLPVESLFAALDRKDLGIFLSYLSPDCRLQYGNHPPVQGQDAIRETVGHFLEQIADSRHDITRQWHQDDAVICHGDVHYTRRDGSLVTIPVAYILTLDEGVISDYRVFLDASLLFTPPG